MSNTKGSKDRKQANFNPNELKMPPKSLEAESAVLGAILLERDAIDRVIDRLTPESFYSTTHQMIFQAIVALYAEHAPIDTITLMDKLTKLGTLEAVGGPYALTKLTMNVVSSANIERHARIIQATWVKRQMITFAAQIHNEAFDDSIDDLTIIEQTEKTLYTISGAINKKSYQKVDSHIVEMLKRIEALRQNDSHIVGVPTGYPKLDRVTHGWRKTDLIILAARPSVGKSALALNFARNAATSPIKPTPVGIFSLEMSASQNVERLTSMVSKVPLEYIITGQMDEGVMNILNTKAAKVVSNLPIYIDDTPGINIFELRGKARTMVRKHGVGLIIIDYLQLMSGVANERNSQNREQEISTISRNLKGLAKELDIPIIALSQLSRKVEERKDKTPGLADLRESGAIEQDADMVMFLYRPEYYGITTDQDGESTQGVTHLSIAKHRNGPLDTITLKADLAIQEFTQPVQTALPLPGTVVPINNQSKWRPLTDDERPELF